MDSQQGLYTGTGTKADLDNHANQCNPNNPEYRGHDPKKHPTGTRADPKNNPKNNPKNQSPKK